MGSASACQGISKARETRRGMDAINLSIVLHSTKQGHLDSDRHATGGAIDGSVEDIVGTWQLFDDTSGLPMTWRAVLGLTRLLLLVDDVADHEVLADSTGKIKNKDPNIEWKQASQLRHSG